MFLDDMLYKKLKSSSEAFVYNESSFREDLNAIYNSLLKLTEEYIKSKLRPNIPYGEFSTLVDRTDKLWESFVKKSLKDEDILIRTVGEICNEVTFKHIYLGNPRVREIYEKGLKINKF